MSGLACAAPLDLPALLDYWLGDLAPGAEEAIEEHLMSCAACAAHLEGLVALGAGIRRLASAGGVWAVVSGGFVDRLRDEGLRVRQYRLAAGGSVQCTVSATDDVVAARFAADLRGVTRVHLVQCDAAGQEQHRITDIPLSASLDEVVVIERTDRLRALPAGVERVKLVTPEAGEERLLGEYTFVHTPSR
jgi:putative zinc finger protein